MDSPGSPTLQDSNPSSSSPDPPKKTLRRQASASFYPNNNASVKPIYPYSRSAAKRESVMALPSIEHLQHFFTKTGLSAQNDLMKKPHTGLVPAIGGAETRAPAPVFNFALNDAQNAETELILPPSPTLPVQEPASFTAGRSYKEIDPDTLRPDVISNLISTSKAWDIPLDPTSRTQSLTDGTVDVLSLLKTTTRAIRSVRTFTLSLPATDHELLPSSSQMAASSSFRSRSFNPVARVAQKNTPKSIPEEPQEIDKPAVIRKAALECLTSLRLLEERARVHLDDEAYNGVDAQSDAGSDIPRGVSPSMLSVSPSSPRSRSRASFTSSTISLAHNVSDSDTPITYSLAANGRTIPIWDTEEPSTQLWLTENERDQYSQKDPGWDERLVISGGWLYRQDVSRDELDEERRKVRHWLEVVDEILFLGPRDGKWGWETIEIPDKTKANKERRRSSTGAVEVAERPVPRRMLSLGGPLHEEPAQEDSLDDTLWGPVRMGEDLASEIQEETTINHETDVPDDELPDWAKRSLYTADPIKRLHSMLLALLPPPLLGLIPQWIPDGKSKLLEVLSSGQILCAAYNVAVRRSRRPWGYVSRDAVHNVLGVDAVNKPNGSSEREAPEKTWTFRRIDNLRLWAGALKLRYLVPIISPTSNATPLALGPVALPRADAVAVADSRKKKGDPSPLLALKTSQSIATIPTAASVPRTPITPTSGRLPMESPTHFDPRAIARKEGDWEQDFVLILTKWVNAVVAEQRGER